MADASKEGREQMTFDPSKALDVVKGVLTEGGWTKTAIAAACGLFLRFSHWGWVPPLEPWMVQAATFGLLLFGFLALASFIDAAHKFFPLNKWAVHLVTLHREKVGLRKFIPYMTPKEREIIGYLLAKNQKTFLAAKDGGHAVTLLSRGIVIIVARDGQQLDPDDVPMTIPDHLWDVLAENRDQFSYTVSEDDDDETEVHPWRDDWTPQRIR
jgi:hypothetical protein